MKVVFHSGTPLPVKAYGGIERIVFWHMVELVKQGHQVVLIGHPDCDLKSFDIEHIPYAPSDLGWEKLIPSDVDIAHLSYNHKVQSGLPTISTVHGNAQPGEELLENSVFVSKRHAEIHGADHFIYNALDFNEYPFDENKKINWETFLFLAKASWRVKNLRDCIRACKRNRKSLEIIGGKTIFPRPRIKSYGFVGGEKKLEIMRKCDALLFPVRWEEPFGIAMIEAMALGLPVIGSQYGSLKEIIKDDVGITCKNFEEFVSSLARQEKEFSPAVIRQYAEDHFSISKHTSSFVDLYRKVCDGEQLHKQRPKLQSTKRAETLLPF